MHTCPPPSDALADWLNANGTVVGGNYGHLLLEQRDDVERQALLDVLRPYFESAHLDAREHFHAQVGIDLHPDGGAAAGPRYPNSLPTTAVRGLFGEVMAGLVTEAYRADFVGGHHWRVPIFLFRFHDDVEKYLWTLRDDPARTREIYGRHGTDFIGIALSDDGEVARVIAGEAKWRQTLNNSTIASLLHGPRVEDEETGEMVRSGRGIWFEVNRDTGIPHGLRQLQRLLEHRDPDGHANAIFSIDRAVLANAAIDRTNLVVIVGNGARRRDAGECAIDWEERPQEYRSRHDLQVVEVILENGADLVDALYASLWDQG